MFSVPSNDLDQLLLELEAFDLEQVIRELEASSAALLLELASLPGFMDFRDTIKSGLESSPAPPLS